MNTIIFDSSNEVGGQPNLLYPFKQIADIPVFNTISGLDLVKNLKDNILNKVTIQTAHRVDNVKKENDSFVIDEEYEVKTIIIATGTGSFKPKKFPLKTNEEMEKKIHYFIKDPADFKNQTIGVFGGGDSALDWANELASYANVKLIHRRDQFRGLESSVKNSKKLLM